MGHRGALLEWLAYLDIVHDPDASQTLGQVLFCVKTILVLPSRDHLELTHVEQPRMTGNFLKWVMAQTFASRPRFPRFATP